MICPFLKEARVRYCRASTFKKMIPRVLEHTELERCSSPAWQQCPVAQQQPGPLESAPECPFIAESLMQYCAASPATKFIPYSESLLSRCGTDGHRYCELYVSMAHETEAPAANSAAPANSSRAEQQEYEVEGISMPAGLYYTANHMWLDVSDEGYCHVGVDAFLARVLGNVEEVSFVEGRGIKRPAVVLTANNVDLHMVFPNRMMLNGRNTYLRVRPEKVTADPYRLGWLFEGFEPSSRSTDADLCAGLTQGETARTWMREEVQRLSEFVHERIFQTQPPLRNFIMDGGRFDGGLVQHLNREETLHLFNDFFSPYATWRRQE
jgi:glycine cleavage system H lipoate-binding protein